MIESSQTLFTLLPVAIPTILIAATFLVTLFVLYKIHFKNSMLRVSNNSSSSKNEIPKEDEVKWLSVSREQFKKLFEDAPVPYFVLNSRGEIKDLNKAGLRFFGVIPEEIIMKNLFSLAAEEDASFAGYLLSCCMSNVPINKKEIRMVLKNGDVKWVQLSVFEITESGGKDASSLATVFDITEQKNLDRAKTEFVSLASHQLRTPLATVKWYTEMLLSSNFGELNQKQREYMTILSQVNRDMIDLVETLLNVSRIEIGKISINLEQANIQEVTDGILVELSSQIEKKKMNIVKTYDGLFIGVKTDPKLLRIVIHNLVTNAIKYTPEGGTITIHFVLSADGRNQIMVTDTGYGIPQNQQNKVFMKLFRAENVKDISSSQSTGLGLYLVKSMIEAMGGSISFHSEENKGTSFMVSF